MAKILQKQGVKSIQRTGNVKAVSQMGYSIFSMSPSSNCPLSLETPLSNTLPILKTSYKDNITPCEFQSSCRKSKLIVFQYYFHFLPTIPLQQPI